MPSLSDISQKMDQISKSVHDIQEIKTRMGDLNAEEITKRCDSLDTAIESFQKMTAEQKSLEQKQNQVEEQLKFLEKVVSRGASSKNALGAGQLSEDEIVYKKSLSSYLRRGTLPDNQQLQSALKSALSKTSFFSEDLEHASKTLAIGSGPDGGFTIMPEWLGIRDGREFETSPIRDVADIQSTSNFSVEITLDDDEFQVTDAGEVSTRPETGTGKLGIIQIPTHEVQASPAVTQRMLENPAFNVEGYINEKAQSRMMRRENTWYVAGNGSQQARGFTTYPASTTDAYVRGSIQQVNSGDATSLTADGLIDLQSALKESYQSGAVWGMKRRTWGEIIKLKNTQNDYLINPTLLFAGTEMQILGNRVIFMDDMPAIAANGLPVVYGDFRQFYTIVDQLGIMVLRDPYSRKSEGLVEFQFKKWSGGAVTNYEAGKLLKISV